MLGENGKKYILVGQAGWVLVGTFYQEGCTCCLRDASVVRQWGTQNGLGEIAIGGPTSKTVLDKVGDVSVKDSNVVLLIRCVESSWQ